MGGRRDLLEAARRNPSNVRFTALCALVESVGYVFTRQKGSHRIYVQGTRPELPLINLQKDRSGKAKPYQVRQVMRIIDEYGLMED
jgi:hypothetical protein